MVKTLELSHDRFLLKVFYLSGHTGQEVASVEN